MPFPQQQRVVRGPRRLDNLIIPVASMVDIGMRGITAANIAVIALAALQDCAIPTGGPEFVGLVRTHDMLNVGDMHDPGPAKPGNIFLAITIQRHVDRPVQFREV